MAGQGIGRSEDRVLSAGISDRADVGRVHMMAGRSITEFRTLDFLGT